jgi:hypothetical protein
MGDLSSDDDDDPSSSFSSSDDEDDPSSSSDDDDDDEDDFDFAAEYLARTPSRRLVMGGLGRMSAEDAEAYICRFATGFALENLEISTRVFSGFFYFVFRRLIGWLQWTAPSTAMRN